MEMVVTSASFTKSELEKINLVLMYLQVLIITDIATATGTHIATYSIIEGSKHQRQINYITIQ